MSKNKLDLRMNADVDHDNTVVEPSILAHKRDIRNDATRNNKLRNRMRTGFVLGLIAIAGTGIKTVHNAHNSDRVSVDLPVQTVTEQTPAQNKLLEDMDNATNPDGKDAISREVLPEDTETHVK